VDSAPTAVTLAVGQAAFMRSAVEADQVLSDNL
jgi:hypothetical protein